jgi:hypothetical protein
MSNGGLEAVAETPVYWHRELPPLATEVLGTRWRHRADACRAPCAEEMSRGSDVTLI